MADTLITGTTLIEKESRSIGDVPIGGIIPWLKNLSGVGNLPEGWVLCDGSTVSDALSPLNGVTIPDLNGDAKFLRGNNTAGGTGGATTSAHIHNGNPDNIVQLSTAGSSGEYASTMGSPVVIPSVSTSPAIIPPFHNVVWICRTR